MERQSFATCNQHWDVPVVFQVSSSHPTVRLEDDLKHVFVSCMPRGAVFEQHPLFHITSTTPTSPIVTNSMFFLIAWTVTVNLKCAFLLKSPGSFMSNVF